MSEGLPISPIDAHGIKMSLYKRDFGESRKEVAKAMGLDSSEPFVKTSARILVRSHFERDLKSSDVENSGTEKYEGESQFLVINGEATYLEANGLPSKYTFSTFHERNLT